MRKEWVWCKECGVDLEIGLVELVRNPQPKCEACRAAGKAQEGPKSGHGGVESGEGIAEVRPGFPKAPRG